MKIKILTILLIISLAINIGVLITVINHCNIMKSHRQFGQQKYLMHYLGLNQEQTAKIEDIKKKGIEMAAPLRDSLIMKRKELIALLKNNPSDTIKSDSLLKEIVNLQGKMESYVMGDMRDIMKNLTPEQCQKFCECFEKRLCCKKDSLGGRAGMGCCFIPSRYQNDKNNR